MDERELRAMAEHYKRIASLVTDEDISKALLELAAKYEAMAKSLRIEPPDRREWAASARPPGWPDRFMRAGDSKSVKFALICWSRE
jgi:hypothetical protein